MTLEKLKTKWHLYSLPTQHCEFRWLIGIPFAALRAWWQSYEIMEKE